jgi:ribosomal protein S13
MECSKARLVVIGCKQRARIDFEETFAPITKWNTIKAVNNIKVNKLTKYQIDQIIKIISQNYLIDLELKRVIQRDIKQLMNIGCYHGFHHNVGLPLRGQQTHTNAKTCRKFRNVLINQRS